MRCEGCGASVFEGEVACGECGRELPERPRVVSAPLPSPQPEAPPVEPIVPEVPPAEAPAPAARCAVHFDLPAVGTCSRCGRFGCAQCLERPRRAICPECQRRLRLEENPKELTRLRRELKVSFFFAALVTLGFGVVLPIGVAGARLNLTWLAIGGVLTAGLLACAVGFLVSRASVFAWGAVILEALGAMAIFMVVGSKLLPLVLLAFPAVSFVRLLKWHELEREAIALAR